MGKSGHIAHKIAATFASTGTPAQFVHPAEASHGDLGMIALGDSVLALSNSGDTAELSDIVAYTRRFGIPLVAMTRRESSALAEGADIALVLPASEEACPMGLAPTTSTTMMLALGDALPTSSAFIPAASSAGSSSPSKTSCMTATRCRWWRWAPIWPTRSWS
jgi:arabinose-5-phosphate isomerase